MPIEITQPQRAKGVVHKQIAETAKGLALEHYEVLARDNLFYKRWPKKKAFVGHNWRHYIPMARQIMVAMLGNPKYDEKFKKKIFDAILLDGAVNPRNMAKPQGSSR